MIRERAFSAAAQRLFSVDLSKQKIRYLIALVVFVVSMIVRLLLLPVQAGFAFLTFYPAIAIATLLCGSRAALVVVVLGGFSGYYMFMEPIWAFKFSSTAIIALSVYAFSGTILCFIARRQQEADDNRSLLSAIVDSSEEAIVSKTLDGMITSWNAGAQRLFGYTAKEVIGLPMTILFPPDRLGEEGDVLARIACGEVIARYETLRVRKDGSPINVSVTMSPIRDRRGRIMGASKSAHKITARERLEKDLQHSNQLLSTAVDNLATKNEDLRRSNEDLERFAYVASHDLQTPLRAISLYTQLLERNYKSRLDEDADQYISFIVSGAKHMARLITDLLDYARVTSQGKPLAPVSARLALDQARANLQTLIEETGGELSSGELPEVLADETQLVSLFQNLIGNAIKYRHPDRAPRVTVTAARHTPTQWRFAVTDNGIGIEAQYFKKIFEIFQRLAPRGDSEGTGVGLAVCQRIVHRFGGDIWVDSALGEGSTFTFTISAV